jgi:cation:H+ antiporter
MTSRLALLAAFALTLPGLFLRVTGSHLAPPPEALAFGAAVLGAAFLLSWAAEVAQLDISQAAALAILALIAVLPEYAVDLYFTWTAASRPEYGAFAAANMTGANRLLIGVAWPFIILLYWLRKRRNTLALEPAHRVELSFLGAATVYAFLIPLRGTFALLDTVVLLPLFAWYAWRVSQTHAEEPELVGPAQLIGRLAPAGRRGATLGLFAFSGAVIFASAEPFAEALVGTGETLGLDRFLLIQWLAPLASEAPEFIIAALLTWRGQATAAFGALISSKINQWSLLVGMIPLVYSVASGAPSSLVLDAHQIQEVLLTAAQSLFAMAIMLNLYISRAGAAALFVLFIIQFLLPGTHLVMSILYLIFAVLLIVRDRHYLAPLFKGGMLSRPAPAHEPD